MMLIAAMVAPTKMNTKESFNDLDEWKKNMDKEIDFKTSSTSMSIFSGKTFDTSRKWDFRSHTEIWWSKSIEGLNPRNL